MLFTNIDEIDLQSKVATTIKHIMVVDDDCDDSSFITDSIKAVSPKYSIHCLDKSQNVMKYLDTLKDAELPHLIILDNNMPVATGVDVLKVIKFIARYKSIPVAVYSSSNYGRNKEECMKAGACIYLPKSCLMEDIKKDVQQMLSHCF